jgi:hypothetical protein
MRHVSIRTAEDGQESPSQRGALMPPRPQLVSALNPALPLPQRGALLQPVVNLEEPVRKFVQERLKLSRVGR